MVLVSNSQAQSSESKIDRQPKLQTNGLYRSDEEFGDPTKINLYLRFCKDGTVLKSSVAAPSTAIDLRRIRKGKRNDNLNCETYSRSSGSFGKYEINGSKIKFTTTSTETSIDYDGEITENGLRLNSVSRSNGHTVKGMKLSFFPDVEL